MNTLQTNGSQDESNIVFRRTSQHGTKTLRHVI